MKISFTAYFTVLLEYPQFFRTLEKTTVSRKNLPLSSTIRIKFVFSKDLYYYLKIFWGKKINLFIYLYEYYFRIDLHNLLITLVNFK